MKQYSTSAALALMFGTAAVIAGCPGDAFETSPFDFDGCTCENAPEPCHINVCEDGEICTQVVDPEATGTSCGMGRECNGLGECLLTNGQPCRVDGDCLSNVCADGVCCESTCDGECRACNVPGPDLGKCVTSLPVGWPDDSCKGMPGIACVDQECTDGGALGEPCGAFNGCLSDTCVGGYCRLPIGGPCNDPVQCRTNFCDLKINECAEPMDASNCRSGEFITFNGIKRCRAAPGEPCLDSSSIDCTDAFTCSSGICRGVNNAPCAAHYLCLNDFCNIANGQTAGSCTFCPPETTCSQGFPIGAYCREDADCTSGNCTGFPQTCQPMP